MEFQVLNVGDGAGERSSMMLDLVAQGEVPFGKMPSR